MEKHHPEFFARFPDTATTCTVLDKIQKKIRHSKKHYKDGDMALFIQHLQEAHSMIEHVIRDFQ